MGIILKFNAFNIKKRVVCSLVTLIILLMSVTSCAEQSSNIERVVFVDDAAIVDLVSAGDNYTRRCCLVFLYSGDLPDLHINSLYGSGIDNISVENEFVLPSDDGDVYNSYKIGYYYVDFGFSNNNSDLTIDSALISISGKSSVTFTPQKPFTIKSEESSSGIIQMVSPFPMGVAVGQKAVFGYVAQTDLYVDSFSLGDFVFLDEIIVSSDNQGKNILDGDAPYFIKAGDTVYFSGIISVNELCEYTCVYCSSMLTYHTDNNELYAYAKPFISEQLGVTIDEKKALPLMFNKID